MAPMTLSHMNKVPSCGALFLLDGFSNCSSRRDGKQHLDLHGATHLCLLEAGVAPHKAASLNDLAALDLVTTLQHLTTCLPHLPASATHEELGGEGGQQPEDHTAWGSWGLDLRHESPTDALHLVEQNSGGPDAVGIVLPPEGLPGRAPPPVGTSAASVCGAVRLEPAAALKADPSQPPPVSTIVNATNAEQLVTGVGASTAAAPMAVPPGPKLVHSHKLSIPLQPGPGSAVSGSCGSLEEMPQDLLALILTSLDPTNRHAASATCERLLSIAQPTFHAMAVTLPEAPCGGGGGPGGAGGNPQHAPAALRANLAALPAERFDTIGKLELALPAIVDRRQLRSLEEPSHPLNAWLASYLQCGNAGAALHSLRIRPLAATTAVVRAAPAASAGTAAASLPDHEVMRLEGAAGGHGDGGPVFSSASGPAAPQGASGALVLYAGAAHGQRGLVERPPLSSPTAADPSQPTYTVHGFKPQPQSAGDIGDGHPSCRMVTQPVMYSTHSGVPHTSSHDECVHAMHVRCGGPQYASTALSPQPSGRAAAPSLPLLHPKESGSLISGRALQLLAAHCPNLSRLSLPLLAPSAAPALPALAGTLRSLSFVVQDTGLIDAALQLRGLTHLSLTTHSCLLSLSLQQQQVVALASLTGLRSLHLAGPLLPDTDAGWAPLAALTDLTELRVSFPFDAHRLKYLTQLRALQLPLLTTGSGLMGLVAAGLRALTELRCRCVVREEDVVALGVLSELRTLQIDSMLLQPPEVGMGVVQPAALAAAGVPAPAGGALLQQMQPVQAATAGTWIGVQPAAMPALPWQPEADTCEGVWATGSVAAPCTPPPPWAPLAAHYAGLQLPSVRTLILTGAHVYHGELGAVFPNIEALAAACVELPPPAAMPPAAVPMRALRRLAWPAGRAVPQLLAASPMLSALTLTGVSNASRLEESLAPPMHPLAHTSTTTGPCNDGVGGRGRGGTSSTGTSDAAAAAWPGAAPGSTLVVGYPPGLTHIALALQGSGHTFKPKLLRGVLEGLHPALRTQLCSLTLRDLPSAAAAGRVSRSGGAGLVASAMGGSYGGLSLALAAHQPTPLSMATQAAALEAAAALDTAVDGGVGEDVEGVFGSCCSAPSPAAAAPSHGGVAGSSGHGGQQDPAARRRSLGCRDAWRGAGAYSASRMAGTGGDAAGAGEAAACTYGLPCSAGVVGERQGVDCVALGAALAACGRLVDEGVVVGLVGALPGLRSLRVEGAGALTSHGLREGMRASGARLERLVVVGCPRLPRSLVEGLGSELSRPWLRASWLP